MTTMIVDRVYNADGQLLEVREYPDLAPVVIVPEAVTETQFMRASVKFGIVTADEAEAYLARGELPAFVLAALSGLPDSERADQRLKAIGSDRFRRDDGLFSLLIASGAVTSAQVDDLFILAGQMD